MISASTTGPGGDGAGGEVSAVRDESRGVSGDSQGLGGIPASGGSNDASPGAAIWTSISWAGIPFACMSVLCVVKTGDSMTPAVSGTDGARCTTGSGSGGCGTSISSGSAPPSKTGALKTGGAGDSPMLGRGSMPSSHPELGAMQDSTDSIIRGAGRSGSGLASAGVGGVKRETGSVRLAKSEHSGWETPLSSSSRNAGGVYSSTAGESDVSQAC